MVYGGSGDDSYIENCSNECNVKGTGYIGGIAGYSNGSRTITECYNKGKIECTGNSTIYAGGIVGFAQTISLKNSYNDSIINITGDSNSYLYIGGLIGGCSSSSMENCYNNCNIDVNTTFNAVVRLGGLIGDGNLSANNCYNEGNLSVPSCAFYSYIGGLVGYSSGGDNFTDCYNRGSITGMAGYVGGLNGYTKVAIVNNCYNSGDVVVDNLNPSNSYYISGLLGRVYTSVTMKSSSNTGNVKVNISSTNDQRGYIGGLIGGGSGTIEKCFNNGDIEVNDVNSEYYLGGIAGNSSGIKYCYNKGSIIVNSSASSSTSNGKYPYIGGIVGSGSVEDCYNNGNVTISSITNNYSGSYLYYGGISGNGSITNCYNTGNAQIKTDFRGLYVANISGSGNVTNCYNTGNLSIEATPSLSAYYYVSGISGSGSVTNCYNIGNLKSDVELSSGNSTLYFSGISSGSVQDSYNTGLLDVNIKNLSETEITANVGGISANSTNVNNNYVSGDIKYQSENITNNYIGKISGYNGTTQVEDKENYYLDTMNITVDTEDNYTIKELGTETAVSEVTVPDITSEEYYNILNVNNVWTHIDGLAPKLISASTISEDENTQIEVENRRLKYNITTEVKLVDGQKGGTISGEGEESYEEVEYDLYNRKEIVMQPYSGYSVSNVTINGKHIHFESDEYDIVTIPVGYIENVREDKHVVVEYCKSDNILVINKVDSDDNTKVLPGAKFNIDSTVEPNNYLGKLTNNATQTNQVDYKVENGVISLYNTNPATAYIEVDLTNKEGNYNIVADFDSSALTGGLIVGQITDNSTSIGTGGSPYGKFIYISGKQIIKTYSSPTLEGGKKYYLHLTFTGGSGNFNINSIKLMKNEDQKTFENNSHDSTFGVLTQNGDYGFKYTDGNITTSNEANGAVYKSYIKVDLSNLEGKYAIVTNATSKSNMAAKISNNTNPIEETSYNNNWEYFMWVNGGSLYSGVSSDYDYVSEVLEGGREYYIHLSANDGTQEGYGNIIDKLKLVKFTEVETFKNTYGDTIALRDVETDENGQIAVKTPAAGKYIITETEAPEGYSLNSTPIEFEVTGEKLNNYLSTPRANANFYFVKDGDIIKPNNINVSNSTEAKSYLEIDLTNRTGRYFVNINAETNSSGLLYARVTDTSDSINYDSNKDFMFIYGTHEADDYLSNVLEGGNKYYLHLGYTGGNPVVINSIDLYEYNEPTAKRLSSVVRNGTSSFYENSSSNTVYLSSLSSESNSYIEVDLTNKTGDYGIVINAQTTGSASPLCAQVTDNTTALTSGGPGDYFMYISGNSSADDYCSKVLKGGNKYYLHLRYFGGNTSGATATINSIDLIEVKAIRASYDINVLTIENKLKQPVVVHHYLKDQEGNYTTVKVADDEELGMFDIGEKYTTSPKTGLDNLELEKDSEGKYTLPINASGEVVDGGVEVIYYYETKPIELTIRHYLEGTKNELVEPEAVKYSANVTIEENEVKSIDIDQVYEVEENNNYKTLKLTYAPTMIIQDNEEVEEEEIEFSNNSELLYFYAITDSAINVKYVDKDTGIEIEDADRIPGIIGEDYTVDIKEIDGFTYVERDGELTGKFEEEEKTIILYYKKNATVIVNYKERITDPETEEVTENVLDTVTANGLVGDEYTAEEKTFTHYRLVERPENETVVMTSEPIVLNYYYEKIKTEVVEKHIDDITEEVLYEETHIGDEGDAYSIASKEFTGYDLVEDKLPENASGTRDSASIEVIYYYKKQAEVLVQYIDSATEEPIPNQEVTIEGHEGDPYETEEKEIEGYDLDETKLPDNAEGTMTVTVTTDAEGNKVFENQIIVKYYYKAKSKVIERHYDNKSEELIEDETVTTGHEGDEYSISPKAFTRYVLNEDRLPDNSEGTMTKDDIIVNYYYKYVSTVTIRYVDEASDIDIIPAETEELFEGETYKAESKEIEGYELDTSRLPAEDGIETEIGKEDKEIIYYYKIPVVEVDAVVTENHIDVMDNTNILATRKITGKVGDEYKTSAKEFAKYDLVEDKLPENAEGTMTEDEIVVNYYYKYRTTITTRYVDEDTGKDIGTPEVKEVPEGDTYTTTSKVIDGYDLDKDKLPENAEGEASKSDVEVIYYYKKKDVTVEDAKVIARYVDIITNDELDRTVYTGKVGGGYKTEAKEIEKYDLVGIPENEKGTMTKEDIIVTYYYKYRVTRTVRYVDVETGKDLVDKEVVEVHEGDTYTTKEIEIEGYTLIKKPSNSEGTMTKKDEVVVYYYKKNVEPVVVEKVVENTVEVEKPTTIIKTVKTGDNIIKLAIVLVSSIIVAVVAIIKKDNK